MNEDVNFEYAGVDNLDAMKEARLIRAVVAQNIDARGGEGTFQVLRRSFVGDTGTPRSYFTDVLFDERVPLMLAGPGENNATLFTVHEGLKVRVRGRAPGWLQVSLDNGLSGWLPEESIAPI